MNLALYRKLFVHRGDVFAEQQASGDYYPVRRELTDADIAKHLVGEASYGVYVIDPGNVVTGAGTSQFATPSPANTVSYVVFDLDTYDAGALDFLKRAVLRLVGTAAYAWDKGYSFERCLLLEDSGGKGYHVWLFLSEPVAASKVRAWTSSVAESYREMARTTGQMEKPWPALEIFPKQDAVVAGAYGNLVKLPFGVHAKTRARAIPLLVPGWASTIEDVVPFDVALIPNAPAVKRAAPKLDSIAPFACVSRIIEEGAGSGLRDNALYHFARYARSCGMPDDLVTEWCERVNEGFDPPLTPQEVQTKVRSALAATTANPGCSADWLDGFCPGGGNCFAPWNDRKASKPNAGHMASPQERQAWRRP